MRPTIPALELQRIIRTLAIQLRQNPVPGDYARGYRDALAGVALAVGVHPATAVAHAELLPVGDEGLVTR